MDRRLGRTGNSRTREVLHRVLYPNAHTNGIKKKKKKKKYKVRLHLLYAALYAAQQSF